MSSPTPTNLIPFVTIETALSPPVTFHLISVLDLVLFCHVSHQLYIRGPGRGQPVTHARYSASC